MKASNRVCLVFGDSISHVTLSRKEISYDIWMWYEMLILVSPEEQEPKVSSLRLSDKMLRNNQYPSVENRLLPGWISRMLSFGSISSKTGEHTRSFR